jgi:tetratricopeptide (TPR) repeat protein
LVLALACALVWGQSLTFGFVWDDQAFIVRNEVLRSPAHVLEYFTSEDAQRFDPTDNQWGIYRPLRTLHYALLIWPFGKAVPWVFHTVNLLWHGLAAGLLYLLLCRVLMTAGASHRRLWALLAAAGFSVHPVTAEVVCWAKSLDDLIAATLFLGAMLAAWRAWEPGPVDGRDRRLAVSTILFAGALWSKESAVALFPLFLFPLLCWGVKERRFWLWLGAQALVTVAYLAARHAVLGSTAQVKTPLSGTYAQTLIDMLPVVLLYARTMLGIGPYLPDYNFMDGGTNLQAPANLAGAVVLIAGAGLLVWSALRGRRHVTLWLGLAWIALALFPVSNLVPMMQYFAERFVYLPLLGLFILLTGIVVRQPRSARWLVPAAGVVVLVWSASSVTEAGKWRNEDTLIRCAYRNSPPSKRIVVNYLAVLSRIPDDAAIAEVLVRHEDLLRGDPKAEAIRGAMLLRRAGMTAAAERKRAVAAKADDPAFLLETGGLCARTGQFEEALRYFRMVTERWPDRGDAWRNLGLCLNDMRRYPEAAAALEQAVRRDPADRVAWQGLSYAAWQRQDWPAARRALKELSRLEPGNPQHRSLLARMPG